LIFKKRTNSDGQPGRGHVAEKLQAICGTLALSIALLGSAGSAKADIFSWTFGGGTDPVSGAGTLTAVADPVIAGAFDITSGAGTLTDPNGTYNVTFLTLAQGGGNTGLCSNVWGEGWAGTAQCGTLAEPPGSGGADYPYDNLIYPNALPNNSVLDANGIVLYNAAGPQAETYFDLWSAANQGNPLPDSLEWSDLNPWAAGSSVNLANPFSVTDETVTSEAATPEPQFYGVLGLGLAGLIALMRRRKIA
jgi:MYXO-CTERM domain-containing protein